MNKIASPKELQTELRRLLAASQDIVPSREGLAKDLRALADRVAAEDDNLPKLEAEKLADLLKKNWQGVKYKKSTGNGSAYVPGLGDITWHSSGSDPAVVVSLPSSRFKADPETAADVIRNISKLLLNV